jgi:hypothetical protein
MFHPTHSIHSRVPLRGTTKFFYPSDLFAASEPGAVFDPSDASTVFTDTAGTTLADIADAVARVNDKSGNDAHATQGTVAARPHYARVPATGRRNQLEWTEEFEKSEWGGSIGRSADGQLTASGTGLEDIRQTHPADSAQTFTATVEARLLAGAGSWRFFIQEFDGVDFVGQSFVDLSLTSEYQTFTVTHTVSTGDLARFAVRWLSGAAGDSIQIRKPQLELGDTPTAYQRVGSQYDVTEAGVRSLRYLSFDGVDDFMVTPTITPNTDKVQVFAGLRKLSEATAATILEFSASVASNNGSFQLAGPANSSGSGSYGFRSGGTLLALADSGSPAYLAPQSAVLSGIGEISTDTAILHWNGSQVRSVETDQGTGNYLAYPLYIGMRGGSSLPFSGHLYGIVVRFGPNLTATEIARAERWTARRTGVSL